MPLHLNDNVRILNTDGREYLHGMIGTVTSVGRTATYIDLLPGQDIKFPTGLIDPLLRWNIRERDMEVLPVPVADEGDDEGSPFIEAAKRESWQAGYEAGRAEVVDGPDLAQPTALARLEAAIAAEPVPVTLAVPGFYTIVEHDGRLIVESFTSSTVLDKGDDEGEAVPPPGVWVTSRIDNHSNVLVDSIHDEELDAYRALDPENFRPRVTYVEFGAPVQDVIIETHSIR